MQTLATLVINCHIHPLPCLSTLQIAKVYSYAIKCMTMHDVEIQPESTCFVFLCMIVIHLVFKMKA